RPVARESPLDAGAHSPAGTCVQTFKAESGTLERTRDGKLVAGPGGAAPDIKQPAIDRIAETGGDAGKEVRPRFDKRRVTGIPFGERDQLVAFDGCAGRGALDTDYPVGGELVIAAELSADHPSGGADTNRGNADCARGWRNVVLHKLHRVRHILFGPAAAGVHAQEAAGPGEKRHRGWRLDPHVGAEGRDAQCRERSTCEY